MPTLEQRVLIELLAGEISGKSELFEAELKAADWGEVLKEAKAQAVPIMAAQSAVKYKEYISDFKEWELTAVKLHYYNFRACLEEQKLNKIIEGHPFCILKGMSAALYYPNPKDRCLGDIDFLVNCRDQKKAEKLLLENGYQNLNIANEHHVTFNKTGVHLEMHFEIPGIPNGNSGETVREYVKNLLDNTHTAELDNYTFPAPDDICHGLIILLHMQHHMVDEGLGLRHICDWACYLNKTKNDPFWQELLELFQKIGILTYAKVMTKISSMYFHINCPEWANDADEQLCEDVIKDVLKGGNFGKKDKLRSKSSLMIAKNEYTTSKLSKVSNLFWILHMAVMTNYPSVKKIPILYPVFYCYRGFLYAFRMLAGKRDSVFKMAPMAKERKSVYDRLHLFETDNNGK